jgi:hypothetical protein
MTVLSWEANCIQSCRGEEITAIVGILSALFTLRLNGKLKIRVISFAIGSLKSIGI